MANFCISFNAEHDFLIDSAPFYLGLIGSNTDATLGQSIQYSGPPHQTQIS